MCIAGRWRSRTFRGFEIEGKAKLPYFWIVDAEEADVATLTITAKGQVTLKKDLLKHLGVTPGQKIEVEAMPGGEIAMRAPPKKGGWDEIYGMFAGKTDKIATIEEMNEAIAKGWAGLLK